MSPRLRIALVFGAAILAVMVAVVVVASGDDESDDVSTGSSTTTTSATSSTAAGETTTSTAVGAPGQLEDVVVTFTEVASFDAPTASGLRPGEDGMYVAQQSGEVFLLRGDDVSGPVIDISDDTDAGGERGLLGMTFSPEGDRLYLHYTNNNGDTRVDEFEVAGDGSIDKDSRRNILAVEQPFPNHNGGQLIFGPDGFLYLGLGDGGSGGDPQGNGQNRDTLLGKILRIDPTPSGDEEYSIPDDNPFAGGGGRPEIWVFGLRNPWRFSFDSATGDLWIGDVGQNALEEIDYLPAGEQAGANLGWDAFEGTKRFSDTDAPDAIGPVFEYDRDAGCAVIGGVVYTGEAIPALTGSYLFSDSCNGVLRAISLDDSGALRLERVLDVSASSPSHFAEDQNGEVYIFDLAGPIHRLDPA